MSINVTKKRHFGTYVFSKLIRECKTNVSITFFMIFCRKKCQRLLLFALGTWQQENCFSTFDFFIRIRKTLLLQFFYCTLYKNSVFVSMHFAMKINDRHNILTKRANEMCAHKQAVLYTVLWLYGGFFQFSFLENKRNCSTEL